MTSNDDYLWDPEGAPPDDDVARLEESLRPLRYQPGPRGVEQAIAAAEVDAAGLTPSRSTPHRVWWVAAGVVAVALVGAWLFARPAGQVEPRPAWTVRIDGMEAGTLAVGAWLDTDRPEWTQVDVPDLGQVAVAPQSRLRLLRTGVDEHRLELRRGTVRATISAPPRLFIVETPAALAVDLGCVYELDVDEDGNGRLRVDAGWVALERPDRVVRVPAGFSCAMRASGGVGVPVLDQAKQGFRDGIAAFETGKPGALDEVLQYATEDDAVTLFHMLPRVDEAQRGGLVDVLAGYVALPEGVTRAGLVALHANMLERWWEEGVQDMW